MSRCLDFRGLLFRSGGAPPRQWFSQPYPWREAAWWVAKTLFGPARAHAGLVPRLDQNVCTEAITTRMTVGFLGDIMPLGARERSEEHTSELQSRLHLVCRLLL